MTREEAIEIFNTVLFLGKCDAPKEELEECLKMAIEALEKEPCEDAISRVETVKFLENHSNDIESALVRRTFRTASSLVNNPYNLSSVTPTQKSETVTEFADRCKECGAKYNELLKEKTAHWIRWYEEIEHDKYVEHVPHCKCSECGKEYNSYSSQFIKYCSNCGRKMVEQQE